MNHIINTGDLGPQCPQKIEWMCFDDGGKPVSTFFPIVEAVIEVKSSDGTIVDKLVRLRLNYQNGQSRQLEVSLSQVDKYDWEAFDIHCILSSPKRKSSEEVGNLIRLGCGNIQPLVQYVAEKIGIGHIGDTVYFATGDQIIFPTEDARKIPDVKPPDLPFRLDIDSTLSTEDIFEGMRELIGLSPEIGRVLVAHAISGIVRSAFQAAGVNPNAVLVIVGESGMLKSSYVPHIVQLYNRATEIGPTTRFNSTLRFIEDVLYECCECTAVIDDLHTAEAQSIKRRNEMTAEEIIRRIGDDTGRGRMDGKELVEKNFRGNVVFIGEYMVGRESTIPRALVVNLTKRPDGRVLDKYQRHQRLLVSTFYYQFIQWYVDHYYSICSDIDTKFTKFREWGTQENIHGRLQDTYFYLQVSYMIFLSFCKDSRCISQEELLGEYHMFSKQLLMLVNAQQNRFRPDVMKVPESNWLKEIRKFYKKGRFHLSDDVKLFDKTIHDGLIYDRCLCLRKDSLTRVLQEKFPHVELNEVLNFLTDKNVLKRTSEKRTIQIGPLHGARFYAIYLDALEDS